MHVSSASAFRASALLGLAAVLLGAFGAHGMEQVFALQPKTREWWEKAVFYQAIHAAVMLLLACLRPMPGTAWRLFGLGIFFFSGSLYAVAAGGPHWLVHVTPFGGLCLLFGWLLLAWKPPFTLNDRDRTQP